MILIYNEKRDADSSYIGLHAISAFFFFLVLFTRERQAMTIAALHAVKRHLRARTTLVSAGSSEGLARVHRVAR